MWFGQGARVADPQRFWTIQQNRNPLRLIEPRSQAAYPTQGDTIRQETNSFFDFTSNTDTTDSELLGTNGSAYAAIYRDRILSDAIPALTLPIGANPIPAFIAIGRNFDEQNSFQTGWPSSRTSGLEAYQWHHSDFDYVAYPYVHKLFDEIVKDGNLK